MKPPAIKQKVFKIFFLTIFSIYSTIIFAQTNNISGTINAYTQVVSIGGSSCTDTVTVDSITGFGINDTVMMIQMKGATIDLSNTSSFGTILNYNDAGNYEFHTIKSISGTTIIFNESIKRPYSPADLVQLVRVPYYNNVNVTGTLTCNPWNGSTGGVLAFIASGSVTLNANINTNGKGYRGGQASINYYTAWFTNYYCTLASGRGGKKGEGITEYTTAYEAGRGALANGGGAGTDINTAGAGGGNGGTGGHGGNNAVAPSILWGDSGKHVDYNVTANKIFMGAGGGGGHQNNSAGSDGTDGGAIIYIKCNDLVGNNNSISTAGLNNTIVAGIDGAGGGGAGGTIILDVATFTTNITCNVKGGNGGDQNYPIQCHGNGGGGGGGAILYSGSALPVNVTTYLSGGLKGVGQCNGTVNDAANGQTGIVVNNWTFPTSIVIADAGPDTSVCPGTSTTIGLPPMPGLFYQWSNGITTSNQQVNPPLTTTYILTVSSGACDVDSDSVTVNISPLPVPSFNYTGGGCDNNFSFNNTSAGANNLTWYFGDGDSSNQYNPSHLYTSSGNYTVTLVAFSSSGCIDSISQQINVIAPSPLISQFTYTINQCDTSVSFTNQSQNGISYQWNFGDGTNDTVTNPSHTYLQSGSYNVTLISYNVCDTDSIQLQVIVNAAALAQSSFTYTVAPCSFQVTFNNGSLNAANYFWDFGDSNSSTNANVLHTYTQAGIYNVTLVAYNLCDTDTTVQAITLNAFAPVQPSFTFNTSPCDLNVIFNNSTLNSSNYQWNFGDGSIDTNANATHIYSQNGNYNVTLIAYNPCDTDSIQMQVAVNSFVPPQAAFAFTTVDCSLDVNFNDSSLDATTLQWNFGDGQTDTILNPLHQYATAGIYTVTLIATNPCTSDTFVQQVDLSAVIFPSADFIFTNPGCDTVIFFNNNSINADSVLWSFGDGTTDTTLNPSHAYMPGIYNVTLIAYSHCGTDTINQTVVDTLLEGIAKFTYTQQHCISEIQFINESQNAMSYQWNFGDGTISNDTNPNHSFQSSGNYAVLLTVNNGTPCEDSASMLLTAEGNDTNTLFIPNTITPNDDGINDAFEIKRLSDCLDYLLKIYNRWGQQVFETNSKNKFWNGTFENNNVPEGVYFYIFKSAKVTKSGTVTVLR